MLSLTIGVGSLLFAFALTNTLFNALLMQRLAPYQQAKFQTPVQTLGAVGRGIGPYLGTLLIHWGNQRSQGLGPRLMMLFSFCAIGLSILVPSMFCGAFYGAPKQAPTMW